MIEKTGVLLPHNLASCLPSVNRMSQGPVAIIECIQKIPCNPCVDACPRKAIQAMKDINECPVLDVDRCNGCGMCVANCPGLAIFVVDMNHHATTALLKIPYEFFPLPADGEVVYAIDRSGTIVGDATITRVQKTQNKTTILWLTIAKELAMQVRNIRRKE